ncbi:MAG: 30S ribosomal protein S3ae [Candidatus Lokiarchaeota archaeon]|nr:30S ribosomal protein S3ae [Candidatus Lokiarchaeota archaeon]
MSTKSKSKKGRTRRKVVDPWKLKNWYEVYAPKSFKSAFLGQIPSGDETNLIGRTIEVLLYDITRNFKHTHIKLKFRIAEVMGNRCETIFIGHELTRDFVRALIHRGSTRIDGIFNYRTADGFVYRVSAFVVTRRRAKGSQIYTMRNIIHKVLDEFAKSSKHGKFIRGIVYGQYAENLSNIARTIYPLRECQIRKTKLVSYPEGAVDEDYDEEAEVFEERTVELKPHGKQIKKKLKKKEQEFEKTEETDETEETEEALRLEDTEEVAEAQDLFEDKEKPDNKPDKK